MNKPTVFLADLKHNYTGVLTSDAMPLGIGYMKAVMDRELKEIDSSLFVYPDHLFAQLGQNPPDVLMLANYMWNEALSHHFARLAVKYNPHTLVVMGGPNIPDETERKIEYLRKHPHIDIYITGEGDFLATEIVSRFLDAGLNKEKALQNSFHSSVYKRDDEIIATEIKPRTRQLDDIPSPWLTGVMDPFFDGKLAPLFETNRGCPFTCTFCVQGSKWYTRVNNFSLERLKEEVDYIGRTIDTKCPQQKVLRITDSNYGMYERDITISAYIGESQKKYNYPLFIDATTGKNKADVIIKSLEQVNGAMAMYQAVQSLDEEVLVNIKRKNISLDSYEKIQIHVQGRGLRSSSDLILALPGETLATHITALQKLINSGTHRLNNFQSMLLKGSELETIESRNKFHFQSKFRLLPKSFGEHDGEKLFDIEEIVVSTSTFSFGDYLAARQYHFVIAVFWNDSRFEWLVRFIEQMGFSKWDWIQSISTSISNPPDSCNDILTDFLTETRHELFDTIEQAVDFYSKPEHFEMLKNNEIGDNLIYKYRSIATFARWGDICNTVFKVTYDLMESSHPDIVHDNEFALFWNDVRNFFFARYASGISRNQLLSTASVCLNYNIGKWIEDNTPRNFINYKLPGAIDVEFFLNEQNRKNLSGALNVWSDNIKSYSMLVKRIVNDWLARDYKLN